MKKFPKRNNFFSIEYGILFGVMLSVLLTYCSNACAQDDQFQIDGLHIRCAACRLRDDGLCEWSEDAALKIGECETLVERTLLSSQSEPNPGELKTFLLKEVRNASLADVALEVLLQTDAGVAEFSSELGEFLNKYREQIEARLRAKRMPVPILKQLWDLPQAGVRNRKALEFEALIASQIPEIGFEGLLERLPGVSARADLGSLRMFSNSLRQDAPELAKKLRAFRKAVRNCLRTFVRQTTFDCQFAADPNSVMAQKYFERMKIKFIVDAWQKRAISAEDVLRLAEEVDYKTFGSPDFFTAVFEATDTLDRQSPRLISAAQFQQMFSQIQQYDSRFEKFAPANPWRPVFYLTTAVLLLGGAAFALSKRTANATALAADSTLSSERAELRELLAYFGLSARSSQDDLVKRFRELAKETHPDLQESSISEFAEINVKYRRGRELLKKR